MYVIVWVYVSNMHAESCRTEEDGTFPGVIDGFGLPCGWLKEFNLGLLEEQPGPVTPELFLQPPHMPLYILICPCLL